MSSKARGMARRGGQMMVGEYISPFFNVLA